jgi:hypothetical protein
LIRISMPAGMTARVGRAAILVCGCLLSASGCSHAAQPEAAEEKPKADPIPEKTGLPIFVRLRAKAKTEATPNEAMFRRQIEQWLGPPADHPGLGMNVAPSEDKARLILDVETDPMRPVGSEVSIRYRVRLINPQTHAVVIAYPSLDLDWKHSNSADRAEAEKEAFNFAKVLVGEALARVCDPSYLKTRADGTSYLDISWHSEMSEYPHAREYDPVKQRVCLTIEDSIPLDVRSHASIKEVLDSYFYDQYDIGSELVSDPEFADALVTIAITHTSSGTAYQRLDADGKPSSLAFQGDVYAIRCEVSRAKDHAVLFTGEARGETSGDKISTDSFTELATQTDALASLGGDIAKKKVRKSIQDATVAAAKPVKGSSGSRDISR